MEYVSQGPGIKENLHLIVSLEENLTKSIFIEVCIGWMKEAKKT